MRPHWDAGASWLVGQVLPERRGMLDPGLQAAAARGDALSLSDYYRAMVSRQKFGEAMQSHLLPFDVVLTPTLPILAFDAALDTPAHAASDDWLDWNPFTYPFNLTRQPALSLPAGRSASGMPIGLQLVARLYEDDWLVNVATLVEEALGVERRMPPFVKDIKTTALYEK